MRWITLESHAGEAVQAGVRRLTPLSSVVRLDIPGWHGGVIWNRPAAILVSEPGGQERLLPVRDKTRVAQLLILGAGMLGSWLIWLAFRRRKGK